MVVLLARCNRRLFGSRRNAVVEACGDLSLLRQLLDNLHDRDRN